MHIHITRKQTFYLKKICFGVWVWIFISKPKNPKKPNTKSISKPKNPKKPNTKSISKPKPKKHKKPNTKSKPKPKNPKKLNTKYQIQTETQTKKKKKNKYQIQAQKSNLLHKAVLTKWRSKNTKSDTGTSPKYKKHKFDHHTPKFFNYSLKLFLKKFAY